MATTPHANTPRCFDGDHQFGDDVGFDNGRTLPFARCTYCGGVAVFNGKENTFYPMGLVADEAKS